MTTNLMYRLALGAALVATLAACAPDPKQTAAGDIKTLVKREERMVTNLPPEDEVILRRFVSVKQGDLKTAVPGSPETWGDLNTVKVDRLVVIARQYFPAEDARIAAEKVRVAKEEAEKKAVAAAELAARPHITDGWPAEMSCEDVTASEHPETATYRYAEKGEPTLADFRVFMGPNYVRFNPVPPPKRSYFYLASNADGVLLHDGKFAAIPGGYRTPELAADQDAFFTKMTSSTLEAFNLRPDPDNADRVLEDYRFQVEGMAGDAPKSMAFVCFKTRYSDAWIAVKEAQIKKEKAEQAAFEASRPKSASELAIEHLEASSSFLCQQIGRGARTQFERGNREGMLVQFGEGKSAGCFPN